MSVRVRSEVTHRHALPTHFTGAHARPGGSLTGREGLALRGWHLVKSPSHNPLLLNPVPSFSGCNENKLHMCTFQYSSGPSHPAAPGVLCVCGGGGGLGGGTPQGELILSHTTDLLMCVLYIPAHCVCVCVTVRACVSVRVCVYVCVYVRLDSH